MTPNSDILVARIGFNEAAIMIQCSMSSGHRTLTLFGLEWSTSQFSAPWGPRATPTSDQAVRPGGKPVPARARELPKRLEYAPKHGAVMVEYGIVAILKQRGALESLLLADHTPATDGTAEHPMYAAVAMIGAAIAISHQRYVKLGQHHDHRVIPLGTESLCEGRETASPDRSRSFASAPVPRLH